MAERQSSNTQTTNTVSSLTVATSEDGERAYALALGDRINSITVEPLYNSAHLNYLAQYLKGPFQKPSKRRLAREVAEPTLLAFVTRYQLDSGTSPAAQSLYDPRELTHFENSNTNEVMFLNGQPSATWLNALGHRYAVGYLYLHQHLQPLVSGPTQPWNDGTDLPSRSLQTLVLRIPTVVLVGPQGRKSSLIELERAREACDSQLQRSHLALQAGEEPSRGKSIFRRVEVHDANTLVLDQQITATVLRRDNTWTILIWSDAGHEPDISHIPIPPTDDFRPVTSDVTFCPVLFDNDKSPGAGLDSSKCEIKQPLALLSTRYGGTMNWTKWSDDSPLAALEEVFFFQAASMLQYLHTLDRVLCDLSRPGLFPSYEHTKLETTVQYDYVRTSLARAEKHCSSTLDFLKNPPPGWRDTSRSSQTDFSSIVRDFEYLLTRSRSLQKVCEDGKATLITTTQFKQPSDPRKKRSL